MKRVRDATVEELTSAAPLQRPRLEEGPQSHTNVNSTVDEAYRKLSGLQRKIVHEFMADFGKKSHDIVEEARVRAAHALRETETAQALAKQGMSEPGVLERKKAHLSHAQEVHARMQRHAEMSELDALHDMMSKV